MTAEQTAIVRSMLAAWALTRPAGKEDHDG